MGFRKELVGATSTSLILSVLAGGEGHGYDIVRRVRTLSEGAFQ